METEEKLFRYMSLRELAEIVLTNGIMLVNPLVFWDDDYEGIAFRAMENPEEMKIIREHSAKFGGDEDELAEILKGNVEYMLCQSWSKSCDDRNMWRMYSYKKKAVMVRVCRKNLEKHVQVYNIKYEEYNTLEKELGRIADSGGVKLHNVYKTKNEKYRFEDEARAMVEPGENAGSIICMKQDIGSAAELIEGVMVHPEASDEYVKYVGIFCSEHNIKFEGRSKKALD